MRRQGSVADRATLARHGFEQLIQSCRISGVRLTAERCTPTPCARKNASPSAAILRISGQAFKKNSYAPLISGWSKRAETNAVGIPQCKFTNLLRKMELNSAKVS